MIRPILTVAAAMIFTLLVSCKSNEPDTVAPSSPYSADPNAPAANSPAAATDADGYTTTYSGLKYKVIREGTGRQPISYNKVKVHYHGTLPNGTVFDSSVQRGKPSTFGLNQVIQGWTEGIPLMKEGAKYRFIVPPHLGYGERGSPPKIGPNQTLIFDVELLEVVY
ncbi:MAG: FKBP-type peptidyl-prolyl cis-trans isomerase [Verrucomicrobiota bacterium]